MFQLVHIIDAIAALIGRGVRWLTLLMVVLTCAVVFMRYGLSLPSIQLQEASLYLHAALFMLGASYTWQQGGHVRVDLFYRDMNANTQRWVNRLGILLLLVPFCVFLLWVSWRYVGNSWAISERSAETGGLPIVYVLKTLILILPSLLLLQALAEFMRTFMPIVGTTDTASEEIQHG